MNRVLWMGIFSVLAALLVLPLAGRADTTITYQGRLNQSGTPFTGLADLEFRLYDQMSGGNQIGTVQSRTDWPVEDGLFQAELDFGSDIFTDQVRWLEITVDGTVLAPRQAVRPAPMALFALAGNEGPPGPQGPEGPEGPEGPPGDSHWQINGTATFYNDGNVGIGTNSPSALLELVTDSSPSNPTLRLTEQGKDFNRIFFTNEAVADRRWSLAARLDDSNPALDRLNIFHSEEGDLITASGNGSVGVGTNNPSGAWRMDVDGGALIRRNSTIGRAHLDLLETESDFARINFRTQGESDIWALAGRIDGTNPATNIFNIFNSGSGNLMSILGSGEVGIGTTTPDAPMEIRSQNQWNANIGTGRGDFYIGDGSVGLSVGISLGGAGRGHSRIWSKGGAEALFLGTGQAGTVLAVKSDTVGIETTSPQNTLHVNGGTRIGDLAHGEAGLRTVRVDGAGDLTADRPVRHFAIPATAFSPVLDSFSFPD